MKSNNISLLILLVTVCLSGCGGDFEKFPLASAQGLVLCEDQPVPFAEVYFHPFREEGQSAIVGKTGIGTTDENGKFSISTYRPGDGAVIAKHKVRITSSPSTSADCPADFVNNNDTPRIVEVVRGGKNEFTFTLPKRDPRKKLVIPEDD